MSGIKVTGGGVVNADGATINGNGGAGVEAEGGSRVSLDGAEIRGNAEDGVRVDNSKVSAVNAVIEQNGVEGFYHSVGVSRDQVSEDRLEWLIDQAIEEKAEGRSSGVIEESLNRAAVMAGLAMADPLCAVTAMISSLGLTALQRLKAGLTY